jgi:hypothetical protein
VHDADGRPITGVAVSFGAGPSVGVTDDFGRFEASPSSGTLLVNLSKDGYASEIFSLFCKEPIDKEVALNPAKR